jgi:lysophospholipase L1-like esterase
MVEATWWSRAPRSVRMRRLVAGVVVLGVLVSASGCHEDYTGAPAGPKVALIGDSISSKDWSYRAIHDAFEPTYQLSVAATSGFTIADQQALAPEYNTTAPAAVVIELGTNDALQATGPPEAPNPPAQARQRMDKAAADLRVMLAALTAPRCIVVVNIGTGVLRPGYPEWARTWNTTVLGAVAAENPRMRIADWDRAVSDWFATHDDAGDKLLLFDLVHPLPAGQQVLAEVMLHAVDACLAGAG